MRFAQFAQTYFPLQFFYPLWMNGSETRFEFKGLLADLIFTLHFKAIRTAE
jgi:hypothetical protein